MYLEKNKKNIATCNLIFLSLLILANLFPGYAFLERFHVWTCIGALWGISMTYFQKITLTYIDAILALYFIYLVARFSIAVDLPVYKSSRFIELIAYGIVYIQIKGLFYDIGLSYKQKINWIIFIILGASFFEAMVSILQYFDMLASTNEYFKLTGTLNSPNFLGVLLSIGITCIIWLFFIKKRLKKGHHILLLFFLGTFLILIALSNSRTSWLILLTSLLLFILASKKSKKFLKDSSKIKKTILIASLAILVSSFLLVLYYYKKDSADARLFIAKITTSEIFKKPLLGHGVLSFEGGYNMAKTDYFNSTLKSWDEIKIGSYAFNPFNDYLFYLYEIGLIGSFGIAIFMFCVLFYYKKTNESLLGLTLLISLFIAAYFMPVTKKSIFISIGFIAINLLELSKKSYQIKPGKSHNIIKKNASLTNSLFLPKKYTIFSKLFITGISSGLLVVVLVDIIQFKKTKEFYALSEVERLDMPANKLTNLFKNEPYKKGYSKFNYGYYLCSNDIDNGIKIMEKAYSQNNAPKLALRLAYKHLEIGNYKRATELYKSNIGNEPYRYQPKKNLLTIYELIFDHKKRDSLAKLIVDFPVKIPSEKVDEYKQYSRDILKRSQATKHHYPDPEFDLKGNLSYSQVIDSKIYDRKMKFRLYFPDISLINKRLQTVYLADGQQYVKDERFVKTIDKLIHEGKIAPLILVFLDSSDNDNPSIDYRQDYYFCNDVYVNYLTNELIPYLEKYYSVGLTREQRTIYGYSFGGLFAAYAGIETPDYFKNVIMQSPAYHPCPSIYSEYQTKEKLDLKLYMSYGTGNDTESQDLPMVKILQEKGYDLKVNRVEGADHEWRVWMDQTEEIFTYFFKKD